VPRPTRPDPSRPAVDDADPAWLLVGLGNPGSEYAGHRHNVGFMVVDRLVAQVGGKLRRHKRARAVALEGRLAGRRVVLAEPTTYMNDSGAAVSGLLDFYSLEPSRLVVVHDELDLPFARIRLKFGGGDNGHNGLRSIRRSLGTGDYFRARFGIDRPPGQMDAAAYVLRPFSTVERKELQLAVDRIADAVVDLVSHGLESAQQQFNG
jgi:PTH1 family peptidyl-tRNA hydrolase